MSDRPAAGAGERIGERARVIAGRIGGWWRAAPASERAVGVVAGLGGSALFGAFLFGAWHVLFGYVAKGNPHAGLFGLVLAAITGTLLVVGASIVRRRLPPA